MTGINEYLNQVNFRFFRAKVVDNKDPEKLGRVKVWIPDIMYDIDDREGLWALPANTISGGNVDQDNNSMHAGQSLIPRVGDWVWIFFENDLLSRPFYIFGLQLKNQPRVPESQVGQDYWNKWVIFRSPEGRSIWISDDNTTPDSRLQITGKKRQYNKDNPLDSVYKIEDNQSVIIIQEDNENRVFIADYNKNYISINSDNDEVYIYASSKSSPGKIHIFNDKTLVRLIDDGSDGTVIVQNSKCKIKISGDKIEIDTPGSISISTPQSEVKVTSNNIKMQTSGALFEINNGKITIFATESITLQAPVINENPGTSASPSPDSVNSPEPVSHDNIKW